MKKLPAFLLLLLLPVLIAAAAEPFKVADFTFAVPEGWAKVEPSSAMRAAQLEVGKDAAKAEVTFFHFEGGSGGTAANNVTRWFGQFPGSEAKNKTEVVEQGSVKVTFATTAGTFNSGMPGGPTQALENYALSGAILEGPGGNVYVKMTGPEATVKSASEAFRKMVLDAAKMVATGA